MRYKNADLDIPHVFFLSCLILTAAITIYFVGFIFYTAAPIFESHGIINFITGTEWDYDKSVYGIRDFILGTFILTGVTLILAVPISIFTAVFLSEFASPKIRSFMRPLIELLVGIPSVVYGIFGLFVLESIFQDHIEPFVVSTLGFIPIFQDQTLNDGSGLLLASSVLAVMILPTVTSISEDSIRAVPYYYREASYALGATQWETIRKVVLPAASSGILSSIVLGMMRAMGETMAIVMLFGNIQSPLPQYLIMVML